MSVQTQSISRYPAGSLRELISLQFPLTLSLLSGSLMGFCDRLFLAQYSLDAFEAVSYAIYICMIFQVGCMRIATTSQTLIGRATGSQNREFAGIYTWQMVWFSLATMAITLPLSSALSTYFFSVEEVSSVGRSYFYWMMSFNFLFPLGTSLASFFIGVGKARTITYATLAAHSINILLNYSLVFGIKGLVPPMGASGAAIATGLSQMIYCALLMGQFLHRKYKDFGCRLFVLKIKAMLDVLRLGIPTAAARMHNLFIWSLMMKILAGQGEEYLLALSYGSMLSFLLSPLNESATQSLITLFSYYLGAARRDICKRILRTAHTAALCNLAIVSCILTFFGKGLIQNFSTTTFNEASLAMLRTNTVAMCVYFAVEACLFIGFSWAMAQKRALQISIIGVACSLIFGYGGFYFAFTVLGCPARYTWWVIAAHLVPPIPFYYMKRSIKLSPSAHS